MTTNALDALIEASTDMFIKLQDLPLHCGFTERSLIVIVYCFMCFDSLGCCNDLELISQLDDMQKSERHVYERAREAKKMCRLSKSNFATRKSKTAVPNIRTAA